MAEKIKIAELDIDTDALIKSTKDLKKQIDELRTSQKELTKSGQTASKEFVQNAADLKVLSSAYNSNIKAIADSTKAKVDEANRTDLLTLAINGEVTSIKEAREQNKLLNRLRNETNVTTKEGQAQLEQLNAKLDANNEFIKENADAYLKQKINIGNYQSALQGLSPQLAAAVTQLQGFYSKLVMQKTALQASVVGLKGTSKALKLFRIALISTGIGAIVVALGSLISFLSTTQKGIDAVTSVTRPLQAVFQSLIGVLQNLGSKLFDAFSNPKQALNDLYEFVKGNLINRFKAFGVILDGIINLDFKKVTDGILQAGTGVENLTDKIKDSANASNEFLTEAINKGKEIDRLAKEREKLETTIASRQAALNKQLAEQRTILSDTSKSGQERVDAADEAERIQQQIIDNQNELLDLEIEELKIKQSLNDTSREEERQLDELIAKRIDNQKQLDAQQKQNIAARKKLADEERKLVDDFLKVRIEKMQQELSLMKEQRRFEEDSLQKQQDFANEEIAILDQKLKDKLISETEYQTEKLRIENDLKQFQDETNAKELQSIEEFEAKKKELQDAIRIRNEEDAEAREILKQEQEFAKQVEELENLQLTEQQKTDLLALMEEEREIVLAEIRGRFREQEIEAFRNVLQKRNDIEQQAGEAQVAIARSVAQSLIGILGDSLGARLAGIAIDAALQVAQIQSTAAASQAINFAQATATAPPPLNVPFIVQAGIQNASIATNAQIQSANVIKSAALSGLKTTLSSFGKFEDGGIIGIGGKRHSQGGTKFYGEDGTTFEAERGEGIGILNRGAYASFMDFNNRFGSGKSSSGFFQGGGIITQGVKQETINLDNVVQAIQAMPPAVVAVEEIQTVGRQFINVQNMANL